MTPEPLYARSHGPPPTCPFIQPTMRKSDTTLSSVLSECRAALNFSRPKVEPSGSFRRRGRLMGRVSNPVNFFFRCFRPKPEGENPFRDKATFDLPCKRPLEPSPLSGKTGARGSPEPPVNREWSSRPGPPGWQALFCAGPRKVPLGCSPAVETALRLSQYSP